MARGIFASIVTVSLTGCSVIMAATTETPPDIKKISIGSTEKEVQQVLGRPISLLRLQGGDVGTYQYFTGDQVNYKRAGAYAVLDGVTLGLAELVTAPAEMLQGDKHIVTIRYDTSHRVAAINEAVSKAPLPPPEKLVGLDKVGHAS